MAKDTNAILGFAIERASAINGYWNLYIAVATGLVGIMASGQSFTSSAALKAFLTVAFVVFALSNLDAIVRLGKLRSALLEQLPAVLGEVGKNLAPAPTRQYVAFHSVLDLVVLGAIWFVPWQLVGTN